MEELPTTHLDLYPLLISISSATDLISRKLVDHHKKVSFIAATLGKTLSLDTESIQQLAMAGAVHDIGGLSLKTRLDTFEFEVADPDRHTLPGYLLLASFAPFAEIASLVRFHHIYWENGRGMVHQGEEVPILSHIIHLADRIAVQIDPEQEILSQRDLILQRIKAGAGEIFVPGHVDALLEVAGQEAFWFDSTSSFVDNILQERVPLGGLELCPQDLMNLAELFRRIIDFRSRFTATHSSGVAAVAGTMADKIGMDTVSTHKIRMAGLLHDIGKLVVPAEILEKQKPLTIDDFAYIRKHPYYSGLILRSIKGFDDISQWAALHHERLDGTGYPFRKIDDELPTGARVLAVADTFTALTEDRPYRCGVNGKNTDRIMRDMVVNNKLDMEMVDQIHDHMEEIDTIREDAQKKADANHRQFLSDCRLLGLVDDSDDRCPLKL